MVDKKNFVHDLKQFVEGEVILIDKDKDWTSFDVVNKIRSLLSRALKMRKLKVGHAGTLDPLATGLLIVATGKMTKSLSEFQNRTKKYTATVRFGASTPSFDKETEPDKMCDYNHITAEKVEQVIKENFLGEIEQLPPLYSAVKVNGKKAYQLARKGVEKELKPRKVKIYSMEILAFNLPEVTFSVECSAGTYIRSLADDLGKALGSCAHLEELRRTGIGEFSVDNALKISEFQELVLKFEQSKNI